MTLAAIDVGTNSVKLLVGKVSGQRVTPVLHRSQITRLGEGLQKSGAISRDAADRTLAALADLRQVAEGRGATEVAAAGTLVLREAKNAKTFLERCEREAGLALRILTGDEEARLSFQGASGTSRASQVLAIDIGGGSTEIMVGSQSRLHASWSLPVGAVTLTEEFLKTDPPAAEEMMAMSAAIRRHLPKVIARVGPRGELVGIGGTVSAILKLLRNSAVEDPRDWHRKSVEFGLISSMAIHLSLKSNGERESMGLEPGRADVVVAGAWILTAAMSHLEASSLRASSHGLRHGLLIELASGRWA